MCSPSPGQQVHEIDAESLLGALNSQQRAAAMQVRGPVAILAGAGTGKTTTVTHRIAWQVLSGAFEAREVLAVTFTDKAANELRQRLQRLGVRGVEARTFHSAARWMLGVLWQHYTGEPMPDLMPHKIVLLEDMVRALPAPDCFRPRREIAQEIEWAKHQRITPEQYLDAIERRGHEQPLRDPERMHAIYAGYEAEKARRGVWDFEDLLVQLADLLDAHPAAAERLRSRFRAITVDEYQDVNPLQQALLDHWTAGTNDICVVGDDYQTIYAFTGASASYLLEFQQRHPDAHVLRLETSYRSTQRVLDLANRLVPMLRGSEKVLRAHATSDDAPAPVFDQHVSRVAEAAFVARECKRLHVELGVPWSEMAVLYRINARSPEFEAALSAADVPFVVRSGAFLDRPAARGVLRQLDRRRQSVDVGGDVRRAAERVGWKPGGTSKASDEAHTLQEDLTRLIELAQAQDWFTIGDYLDSVRAQFATHESVDGVELSTIHRAKGLEWAAVFLPRLNTGELPFASRTSTSDIEDERRLLYVGLTRAKRHIYVTCASDAGAPSTFLGELALVDPATLVRAGSGGKRSNSTSFQLEESDPLTAELKRWRMGVASTANKPAYTVFDNKTLAEIAHAKPRTLGALLAVKGVGEAKLERYGDEVVQLVCSHARR